MIIILLVLVIIVYQVLDVWQTYMLLQFDVYESNPIMAYMMSHMGTLTGMIVFKSFFIIMLITFLVIYYQRERRTTAHGKEQRPEEGS
jgi:hypothetical protein